MIFVNLLPDIKQEHARAQNIKRFIVIASSILIIICVVVTSTLYFIANIQQPDQIDDITKTNADLISGLTAGQDLEKTLTIQNQLQALPELHAQKRQVDRLFKDPTTANDLAYLTTLLPEKGFLYDSETEKLLHTELNTKLSSINFNFTNGTFTIDGTILNAQAVNLLWRTIQYVGFEDCIIENRITRVYPFKPEQPEATPSNIVYEDEEDLTPSVPFAITGQFSVDLFSPEFEDSDLQLQVPEEYLSEDFSEQPDQNCIADPSDNPTNPVVSNVQPTQEGRAIAKV